ncbi:immunoglobulin-like domain-containing protein [Gottfriedia acidiceleris]|uniref:immunoglobulin-like domain-containing protein n=1 Tax=Gottfriedia acidiceleris TaxID=371036 RepID=UPI00339126B4
MLQKTLKITVAFVLTLVFFFGNTIATMASTDTTPPTVKSISFDKTVVRPGDTILIQVEAEDLETGISDNPSDKTIMLSGPGTTNITGYINLIYNSVTNRYEANYKIPLTAINGTWTAYHVSFQDKAGNYAGVYPKVGDKLYKTFTVEGGSDDVTPPKITSASFDTSIAKPGDTVLIQVEAEDLESGISDNPSNKTIMLRGPGTTNITGYINLTYNSITDRYEARYKIPLTAINGTWSLYYISFQDKAGNYVSVYPKVGDQLYKTFKVEGGSDDITPPVIKSISFDKEVIQPGDTILIQVEAEDVDSGISDNPSNRTIMLRGPGTTNITGYINLTYNSMTNRYEARYKIPLTAINGTWTAYHITFQDKVGNYVGVYPKVGDQLYNTFRVSEDIVAPDAPTVNELTDQSSNVTGTAEENSTIQVKVGNTSIGSGTSKNDGTYSIQIPLQKGGTRVAVSATDRSGNESKTTEVLVTDTTAPAIPIVDKVSDKSEKVTGTAEANSNIFVKENNNLLGQEVVKSDGTYSVPIPLQKAGTILTVYATDTASNRSASREVVVRDTLKPTILDVTDKVIYVGDPFNPLLGITATDNVDGDITSKIVVTGTINNMKPGVYTLTYNVIDSDDNLVSVTRKITVIDNVKPVINGVADSTIPMGSQFDPLAGIIATDNIDKDITNSIQMIGYVDTNQKGVYNLIYKVSDSAGNTTYSNRAVTVVDNVQPAILGALPKLLFINTNFNPLDGVVALDNTDGDITKSITIEGTVNTKKKGNYDLTYTVSDQSGNTTSVVRTITVIDNVKPTITGVVNQSIPINSSFNSMNGIKAADNNDGDITKSVKVTGTVDTKKKGIYKLTYTVSDSSGNTTTEYRTITVVDNVKPIITGATNKSINFGSTFNPLTGVTAKDNVDGDLTKLIKVTGSVNTKKKGEYTLTYTVSDKSGNKTVVVRKISVKDMTKPVIYGATTKTIKLKSSFNPKTGVTARDNVDGDLTKLIKVTGTVNTKKKGTYTLTYVVKDRSGNTTTVYRKVIVK